MGVVFMFFDVIEPKMEGLFGMVGMLLLAIMFIFPCLFSYRKLGAIKKLFSKK